MSAERKVWDGMFMRAGHDIEKLVSAAEARGASRERRAILRLLRKHWDDGDMAWQDFKAAVAARAKPKRGKR